MPACRMPVAVPTHYLLSGMQAGYVCTGACEIDEYCQRVLKRHHPAIPVHPDLHTLDLLSFTPPGCRLDAVVVTTPCVDVSARGLGQAQHGQVRTPVSIDAAVL
jgi:site-specific DNA-cytosine methylase